MTPGWWALFRAASDGDRASAGLTLWTVLTLWLDAAEGRGPPADTVDSLDALEDRRGAPPTVSSGSTVSRIRPAQPVKTSVQRD